MLQYHLLPGGAHVHRKVHTLAIPPFASRTSASYTHTHFSHENPPKGDIGDIDTGHIRKLFSMLWEGSARGDPDFGPHGDTSPHLVSVYSGQGPHRYRNASTHTHTHTHTASLPSWESLLICLLITTSSTTLSFHLFLTLSHGPVMVTRLLPCHDAVSASL